MTSPPDEPAEKLAASAPSEPPASLHSGEPPPPLGPPPDLLPPAPSSPSRAAGFGKFFGGCLITLVLGAAMFAAVFGDMRRPMGCAALQLVYVIPAVIWLLRKRQPAWAYGIVLGGAIVVLMASICGDVGNMH